MDPTSNLPYRRASGSPSSAPEAAPIPDDDNEEADLPLTMTASAVLTHLPIDTTSALATAGPFPKEKVIIRLKAVGSAPILRQQICKISSTQRFEQVVGYVRKVLRCQPRDSVFLYVNSVFAPALDEVVGNLHRCFKDANDQLVVAYSITPAFG